MTDNNSVNSTPEEWTFTDNTFDYIDPADWKRNLVFGFGSSVFNTTPKLSTKAQEYNELLRCLKQVAYCHLYNLSEIDAGREGNDKILANVDEDAKEARQLAISLSEVWGEIPYFIKEKYSLVYTNYISSLGALLWGSNLDVKDLDVNASVDVYNEGVKSLGSGNG